MITFNVEKSNILNIQNETESESDLHSEKIDLVCQYVFDSLEDPDISGKSCGFWNCVSKELDEESGGFLYRFEVKDSCRYCNNDLIKKIIEETFPATQLAPELAGYRVNSSWPDRFRALGYEFPHPYSMTLPDACLLTYRWKKLQENLSLLFLNIVPVNNIADNATFIETALRDEVLLSKVEFIHDHLCHIIPKILRIFKSRIDEIAYIKSRSNFELAVGSYNNAIQALKARSVGDENEREIASIFEAVLSIFIDECTSAITIGDLDRHVESDLPKIAGIAKKKCQLEFVSKKSF
jgi:hypothetical protein